MPTTWADVAEGVSLIKLWARAKARKVGRRRYARMPIGKGVVYKLLRTKGARVLDNSQRRGKKRQWWEIVIHYRGVNFYCRHYSNFAGLYPHSKSQRAA